MLCLYFVHISTKIAFYRELRIGLENYSSDLSNTNYMFKYTMHINVLRCYYIESSTANWVVFV